MSITGIGCCLLVGWLSRVFGVRVQALGGVCVSGGLRRLGFRSGC